jgi:hypothetical protein
MIAIEDISFAGKTFCFTGKLAILKRTQAEREVRARCGFTIDKVTPQLDYLVVGSTPSPSWKYGSYGSKINDALQLIEEQRIKPIFISESWYMELLSLHPVLEEGEIDEKIIVYKYIFTQEENNYKIT